MNEKGAFKAGVPLQEKQGFSPFVVLLVFQVTSLSEH